MQGIGPRFERETVIVFNEDEPEASIWTASEFQYRRLKKQGYLPTEDNERSATFSVPKHRVAIRKPRKLTEKQTEALKRHAFPSGGPRESRGKSDGRTRIDTSVTLDFSE